MVTTRLSVNEHESASTFTDFYLAWIKIIYVGTYYLPERQQLSNRSMKLLESDDEAVTLNRGQRRQLIERYSELEKELSRAAETLGKQNKTMAKFARELKKIKRASALCS